VINSNLGQRPVYLVRLPDDVATLQSRYTMTLIDTTEPNQPVYLVTGRIGGQP